MHKVGLPSAVAYAPQSPAFAVEPSAPPTHAPAVKLVARPVVASPPLLDPVGIPRSQCYTMLFMWRSRSWRLNERRMLTYGSQSRTLVVSSPRIQRPGIAASCPLGYILHKSLMWLRSSCCHELHPILRFMKPFIGS